MCGPLALLLAPLALAGAAVAASPATAQAPCSYYAAPYQEEGGRVPAGQPYGQRRASGTLDAPMTVSDFWKRKLARPGTVLCLKDGLYRGWHSMLLPEGELDGRPDARIEVRALNDGQVWMDGEHQRPVLRVHHSYWTVSGLNVFNGTGPAVGVSGRKETQERDWEPVRHVILRRIVAWRDFIPYGSLEDYEAIGGHNVHVFDLADVEDVLVEDCAGFGWARKIFQNYRSKRVVFRRDWARWDGRHPYERGNKFAFSCSYQGYDALCENLIATAGGSRDRAAMPGAYSPGIHLIATDGAARDSSRWVGPPSRDRHALGLRIVGSLAYLPDDARFTKVAGFHVGGSGFPHKGQKGVRLESSVARVPSAGKYALQLRNCKDDPKKHPAGCSWSRKADRSQAPVTVSRVLAVSPRDPPVLIEDDWRQQGVVTRPPGSKPDIYRGSVGGVSLCHRSVDGHETGEPLWPWPMQERILAATERSNWESADVMGEIAEIFGPPPAACTR